MVCSRHAFYGSLGQVVITWAGARAHEGSGGVRRSWAGCCLTRDRKRKAKQSRIASTESFAKLVVKSVALTGWRDGYRTLYGTPPKRGQSCSQPVESHRYQLRGVAFVGGFGS